MKVRKIMPCFWRWLFSLVILGTASLAGAEEQQRILESSRFFGRGNTYVAAYDSDEGTRGNPAALADPKKLAFQLRLTQFEAFLGENTLDTLSDIGDFQGDDSSVYLQKFADKFGKRQYARAQIMLLAMRIKVFEFSPFVSSSNYVDLRSPTLPEVVVKSDTITGANLATAVNFGKSLSVGINLKPMSRKYISGTLTFSDVMDFLPPTEKEIDDFIDEEQGSGVGLDIGTIWYVSPTFRIGVLGENIGDVGFGDGDDNPPPIRQRLSLGGLWRRNFGRWYWDILTDIQDIVNPDALPFLRQLHLGTEFGTRYFTWDNDIGILLGVNEGYVTSGAYIDFWIARLDITNYAVELGETPGQRMDRRWAATLRSTMNF